MPESRLHSRPLLCLVALLAMIAAGAQEQWNPRNPIRFQPQSDGVKFALQSGAMKLQVCSSSVNR
jgi:hypothetical protein